MSNLNEKVVLITGGTSGYGKATAKLFTQNGAKVINASRKEEELKKAIAEGAGTDYIVLDVTKPYDWNKAHEYVVNKYGRLDILVNNAGGGVAIMETVDQTIEDIDLAISLNLNSVIYASRVFGKLMKEQKCGTIINIASACAKHAWPSWAVYAAAKWGVLGFSKGLYVELQPYNVRVTCMIPGAASTGFQKNSNIGEVTMAMTADNFATAIVNVCALPQHVVVEELIINGIDQIINPL